MLPRKLFLFSTALTIISNVAAQIITASLMGTIHDPSGAIVPNASVVARNIATQLETRTVADNAGRFVLPSLQPGAYQIDVNAQGFRELEQVGVVLGVGQVAELDLSLELGDRASVVEINGQAPLLDTNDSALGQIVSNRSIVNLPLNQRNSWSLIFLTPGTVGSVGFDFNNVNISVNGGRPGDTELMTDGIPSSTPIGNPIQGYTVFPSVDGVQEFKVEATNFSAEFGHTSGGVVNLLFKSGTNALHGTAYTFVRNSALDSNSFFSNAAGVALPSFKRYQYGGSVGGPVVLPHLYNGKNKTFFFADYEGLWQTSASNLLTTVPTLPERNGDFSALRTPTGAPVTIYDPTTTVPSGTGFVRQPFAGNQIPMTSWDTVAKNVLSYFPLPNQPGTIAGANNLFLTGSTLVTSQAFDTKVDENVNDSNRFFIRVSRRIVDDALPRYNYADPKLSLAQSGLAVHEVYNNAAADYTLILSPTFLLDLRAGVGRTFVNDAPSSLGFNPVTLGFPSNYDQGLPELAFPVFQVSGFLTLGNTGNTGVIAFETYSASANLTKVLSRHIWKAGFDTWLIFNNADVNTAMDGSFAFTSSLTQGPNPNVASSTAGSSLASFLMGTGTGSLIRNNKNIAAKSPYYFWYFQDDWRFTQRLTLNTGLRYNLDIPYTERYDRVNLFDPGAPSPLAGPAGLPGLKGGLVFLGTDGLGRRAFPTDANGWDPRFGFAFRIAKATVLRAGYAIFHLPALSEASGNVGTIGYSSSTQFISAPNGVVPVNYLSNPFPTGLAPTSGNSQGLLTGIGTPITAQLRGDNKVPYMQNWHFDVQQQFLGGVVADAAYVSTRGVDLNKGGAGDFNLNQLTPTQLAVGTQLQKQVPNPFYGHIATGVLAAPTVPFSNLLAPFPQFTSVGLYYPIGASSHYDAFQLKIERRFSTGLTFLLSYTGSKLIDDYSNIAIVGATAGIQNIYDLKGERSVSPNDVSRSLVFSSVYVLPFGKGKRLGNNWNRLMGGVFGGWQVNGVLTLATGQPLALTTQQNTSDSGSTTLRPNNDGQNALLSGSIVNRLNEYFNTSVFSQPAPFTFGNTGRTLPNVRSPAVKNLDFSLFKNVRVVERFSLQLRAEAFNLANRVQFAAPGTIFGTAQFGVISAQANTPRQIQIAAKLLF